MCGQSSPARLISSSYHSKKKKKRKIKKSANIQEQSPPELALPTLKSVEDCDSKYTASGFLGLKKKKKKGFTPFTLSK